MPTKEDLSRVESNIKQHVDNNTKNIQKLFNLRQEDKAEFKTKVLEVVAQGSGQPISKERDLYFTARRSLRFWPVEDGDLEQGCRRFMLEILEMPSEVADGVQIEHTRRLQQPRRSKIKSEVLIRFRDSGCRDIVQSYALNLANHRDRAGIRLEIPPHLTGTFRLFEEHAGALREKFPVGVKRSIKFDDVAMDLCIDIKIPTADKWHRFSRSQIEQAARARTRLGGGMSQASSSDRSERESILMVSTSQSASGEEWQSAEDYVEVDDDQSEANA